MPSKEDLQFAVPLCQRRRIIKNGQHGLHLTCWEPLVHRGWKPDWWCGECGVEVSYGTVLAQRAAFEEAERVRWLAA